MTLSNIEIYTEVKNWWIEKNRHLAKDILFGWGKVEDKDLPTKDWIIRLQQLDKIENINNLGRQIRREISKVKFGKASSPKNEELNKNEEAELITKESEDLREIERELKSLQNERIVASDMIADYEKSLLDFDNKIKAVVGDDMTDWESKITKAGVNDKDITDLRKKVTDLQTAKDNADKELKEKQDQIAVHLNHRCDTPNNAELNQTKEELDKASKEITSLKEQLGKNPDNPLPNSPNDKEEEQENNNLTLEQLKAKLDEKRQEIKILKEQLNSKAQQSNNHFHQSSQDKLKFVSTGIGIGILIAATIGGVIYLVRFYKKKKKTALKDNHLSSK